MSARVAAAALSLVVALAACVPAPGPEYSARLATPATPLPPMRSFAAPKVTPSVRSNRELAADFLELSFNLESGRSLPRLTRYEGEIVVGLRGPADRTLEHDLDRLIVRLRREAKLPIRRAGPGDSFDITVEVLPRRQLARIVPQAACFVVPRVTGWDDFRAARRSARVDWTTLERRESATVFLPGDVSPQEARDCLHEEIAQALGPLNDLYRLPDSVFNDDNFHTVLTGFDMLMLRVYYDPALANGMTRDEVAARLPAILNRLNPSGNRAGPPPQPPTPRAWVEEIERALGPRGSVKRRQAAAWRAVDLAKSYGWRDNRMAFSLYALGRLALNDDPELALAAFLQADALYRAMPDTALQSAQVTMQLAAFALAADQPGGAIRLIDQALPAVRAAENAALLSSLLMLRSEALSLQGHPEQARADRQAALGWARYGFGDDQIVMQRAIEIAALAPGPAAR